VYFLEWGKGKRTDSTVNRRMNIQGIGQETTQHKGEKTVLQEGVGTKRKSGKQHVWVKLGGRVKKKKGGEAGGSELRAVSESRPLTEEKQIGDGTAGYQSAFG